MRKVILLIFCTVCILSMTSCQKKAEVSNTIEGNRKTYYEMSDGTWLCDGKTYQYRLEVKGRLNNAVCDTEYVYLSNQSEITFEQAWKASGLSSNTADYFPTETAVLVEMR